MIAKKQCKKIVSLLLCLSLLIFCLLDFSGCQSLTTNKKTKVVIDIQTRTEYRDNSQLHYYSLTTDGEVNNIKAFTADKMEVFTAPAHECFESYFIGYQGKSLNYLNDIILTDEDGHPIEITPIISDIFEETSELEHEIFTMKIFKQGNEYFVYVELNVNWWAPCSLYYYNQDSSRLIKLHTFDNEEVIGIKIHNLGLLKRQYSY